MEPAMLERPIESLIMEFREIQAELGANPGRSERRRLVQRLAEVTSQITSHPDAAEAVGSIDLTWTTVTFDIPPGHFLDGRSRK